MAVAVFDALLPTGHVLRRLILRVVQRRADATATFHAAVVQWLRVATQREATLDEKALQENGTFLSFPNVCPEPVLV